MKLKKQQCPFIWLKTINWLRSNLKERRRINNAILTQSLNWFLLKFITTIVTVCHHHSGANPAPEIPQNTTTYKLPSGRWQLVDMSQIIKPTMVPSIVIFLGDSAILHLWAACCQMLYYDNCKQTAEMYCCRVSNYELVTCESVF